MLTLTKPRINLYRHPGQASASITAQRILYDFEKTGILDKCLSLNDDVVREWRRDPKTFPIEFHGKVICLWKSVEMRGGRESVACLAWCRGNVYEQWFPLDDKVGESFATARQLSI